ncbi:hypothetical protein Tco_0093217 [Tanacetum coccineum]
MLSSEVRSLANVPSLNLLGDVDLLSVAFDSQLKIFDSLLNNHASGEHSQCYSKVRNIIAQEIGEPVLNNKDQHVLDVIDTKSWEVAFLECVKGNGLFGPNGRRGRKVEVRFDDFGGGGEEIGNCGGNGGRGSSIFGRGGGSLAICSMESKDGLRGGGLVVVTGRFSRVSKRSWGEVGGVENKSSMGSMLISKGEECMDGWVGVGGGEVKGGCVDFRVTKSLLGKILRESTRESDGEEFRVNGGAV